jgi:uncharacterized membrane protein YqjE
MTPPPVRESRVYGRDRDETDEDFVRFRRVGGTAEDDRSIGELTSDLTTHAQELIRCELELAKLEMVAEVKQAVRGAALLGAGGAVALVTLVLAGHTIAIALATAMEPWLAYLITTVGMGLIAGLLVAIGVNRLKKVEPMPDTAIDKTKEDVRWLRTHA